MRSRFQFIKDFLEKEISPKPDFLSNDEDRYPFISFKRDNVIVKLRKLSGRLFVRGGDANSDLRKKLDRIRTISKHLYFDTKIRLPIERAYPNSASSFELGSLKDRYTSCRVKLNDGALGVFYLSTGTFIAQGKEGNGKVFLNTKIKPVIDTYRKELIERAKEKKKVTVGGAASSSSSSSSSSSASKRQRIEKKEDEENLPDQQVKAESVCIICFDNEISHALVPCGHHAYCQDCAEALSKCALCRTNISSIIKVYHQSG